MMVRIITKVPDDRYKENPGECMHLVNAECWEIENINETDFAVFIGKINTHEARIACFNLNDVKGWYMVIWKHI